MNPLMRMSVPPDMNVPTLIATYQLRQREYLLRITRAMTSRLELPSLLELILNSIAELVSCRAGFIALSQQEDEIEQFRTKTRFQIRAIYGIDSQLLSAFDPLLDVAPLVPVDNDSQTGAETDLAQYLDDVQHQNPQLDSYFFDLQSRVQQVEENLGTPLGKVVGLPLLFEEELLGIVYLFRNEYAFTQWDWQFLQGFADQAAVAVRNARLYQQLETERSRLATIIQNNADGIMILDAKARVLVINQTLATMLDIVPEAAVGRRYSDVLLLENVEGNELSDVDDIELFFHNQKLKSQELQCEGDIEITSKKRRAVSVSYTPLYDAPLYDTPVYDTLIYDDSLGQRQPGRLVNIIVNVHDITRFREEEEMKSTFTSIISHELKTPVALIKGYAQTLARPDATWDTETARQGLEIIEEEADRLEMLINNLLDASRIQAGGLRLDWSDLNVVALAEKIVDIYRLQSDKHQIELNFSADLPFMWGDAERMRQVLTNLINNAIKYSPQGGVIRVGGWLDDSPLNITAKPEPPRIILYVADQGIGIPPEELSQIFDRFYRVDSGLRRSTAGTGLGLYLCKAIVDAHGGQIWVRSEPQIGTTFFIALPTEEGQVIQKTQRAYSLPQPV